MNTVFLTQIEHEKISWHQTFLLVSCYKIYNDIPKMDEVEAEVSVPVEIVVDWFSIG